MQTIDAPDAAQVASVTRQEVDVASALVAQFPALFAGTIIRCVAQTRHDLLRAGDFTDLPVAIESIAVIRLSELVPARGRAG